jgi:hypothetical protein
MRPPRAAATTEKNGRSGVMGRADSGTDQLRLPRARADWAPRSGATIDQAATLQVDNQVPLSTGTGTVLTTNNTVINDYKNTGIIQRASPRANGNGKASTSSRDQQRSTASTPARWRRVKSSIPVD